MVYPGPEPVRLTNFSSWIITVGDSTIGRYFLADIKLGNGNKLAGVSLYKGQMMLSSKKQYHLVYVEVTQAHLIKKICSWKETLDSKVVFREDSNL